MKITLTSGYYSDHLTYGCYEVPNIEWLKEHIQIWADDHAPNCWHKYGFNPDRLVEWLERQPECVKIEATIMHLGDSNLTHIQQDICPKQKPQARLWLNQFLTHEDKP